MSDKNKEVCCSPAERSTSCFHVESVITIDERGQMVLPKDIRDKANIHAGDKLALVAWEKDRQICCLSLIKVDQFSGMVKNMLGPLAKEIFV